MTNQFTSKYSLVTQIIFILNTIMVLVTSEDVCEANSCSALEKARELAKFQPSRELKKGGEYEGGDYWEKYESIFAEAWSELPRLHPEIYNYNEEFKDKFMNRKLRRTVQKLKDYARTSKKKYFDESSAKNLVTESKEVKDVFTDKEIKFGGN